jgi:2-C-methyl-D-erythritol 2,4-cyclodiphosphate synthase
MLGGLHIPHPTGGDGHSDADVLLHALTDAVLGGLALGDIGDWFPNTDPRWQGASSDQFLIAAVAAAAERGWVVVNADCIIHAQQPKLSGHKQRIAWQVAKLLKVAPECVSVKAKTGEHVGPVGREEAIQAEAVVLLTRSAQLQLRKTWRNQWNWLRHWLLGKPSPETRSPE